LTLQAVVSKGLINPTFGATGCNVNHINARPELLLEAEATEERTL
jgi:hypothetical protein